MSTREQLLEVVSHLSESQLADALRYLRLLAAAEDWPSLAAAQLDDEPYSDHEFREDVETLRRLEPGTLRTTKELSDDLGLPG